MLDNVHSSQNLSAIIRSSDAVGVLDIYYSVKENETLRIHKTITQGAHRWTHRYRINDEDKVAFLKQKKSEGFQVVVTHLEERAVSFRDVDYTKPTLLVMGNEKEGVSSEVIAQADEVLRWVLFHKTDVAGLDEYADGTRTFLQFARIETRWPLDPVGSAAKGGDTR